MKKLLFMMPLIVVFTSIKATPTAQNMTVFGSSNAILSQVSSSLSPYVSGNSPFFFNLVSQTGGTTMLNPEDGSFVFTPISLPASFLYNVTDKDGLTSNVAKVDIVPGPMMSTGRVDETEAG